jgi:hypothetical protein
MVLEDDSVYRIFTTLMRVETGSTWHLTIMFDQ